MKIRLDAPSAGDAAAPVVENLSGTLTAATKARHAGRSEFAPAPDGCETDALHLAFGGDDAGVWSFVVAAKSVDAWVPLMNASVGKRLSLTVRGAKRFQFPASSGFVLGDAEGPLMAAEVGPWVETLRPEDLRGFQVSVGDDICRTVDPCMQLMLTELVFHGDTSASVDRVTDGEFLLHSASYGARNTGGGYLILPEVCADGEHVSTWIIWRKGA